MNLAQRFETLLVYLAVSVEWSILLYFLLLNVTQFLLILRAFFSIRTYLDEMETDRLEAAFETSYYKPITLICPAFNEEAGVVASVNSLISLRYPEFQIVVVNDGSGDATLERLIAAFRLLPSRRAATRPENHDMTL